MAENDKAIYVLLAALAGVSVGFVLGIVFYKVLFKEAAYAKHKTITQIKRDETGYITEILEMVE
jgi:high-affinity Fe2+/Pb2+ permease